MHCKSPIKVPAASILNRLFTYVPSNGDLVWNPRPIEDFQDRRAWKIWNTRYSGRVAGSRQFSTTGKPACIIVAINRTYYRAHRLIWAMVHGSIPDELFVDHININPFDNALSNLRLATHPQNMCNTRIRADNTSGYKGVTMHKPSGMWHSRIYVNGKMKSLGHHKTRWGAYAAYLTAAKVHHGAFVPK